MGTAARALRHPILCNAEKSLEKDGYEQPIWRIQPEYMIPSAAARLAHYYDWDLNPVQVIECIARAQHADGIESGPVVQTADASIRYQFQRRYDGLRLRFLGASNAPGVVETDVGLRELTVLMKALEKHKAFTFDSPLGSFSVAEGVRGGLLQEQLIDALDSLGSQTLQQVNLRERNG